MSLVVALENLIFVSYNQPTSKQTNKQTKKQTKSNRQTNKQINQPLFKI